MKSYITPCPENADDEKVETIEFSLIGLVATTEFQKSLAYIEALNKVYPKVYSKPYIRPMLEFDWLEYVTKMQRKTGKQFWHLTKNCVVFANKEYLGSDDDLMQFISQRLIVKLRRNYEGLAQKGLLDVYQKFIELGRKFVYLSIAVNRHVIGHMIFMLYADLVPQTSKRFVKKCKSRKKGYKGTAVHRIMASSWIQFGDYSLPLKNYTCENYIIPHNRRGVLSMCNDGRHTHNSSQFFVCLNPTYWMDYNYVAFGQLVQGDGILKELESIRTYYEHPQLVEIIIADCGEITLEDTVQAKHKTTIENYLSNRDASDDESVEYIDPHDTASILLEAHYLAGDYCYENDNEVNLPMKNLPSETKTIPPPSISICEEEEEVEVHDLVEKVDDAVGLDDVREYWIKDKVEADSTDSDQDTTTTETDISGISEKNVADDVKVHNYEIIDD